MERDIAMHRANPSPTREKRAEAGGDVSAGLGQRGTTARPLDCGVLTRWGARTPARGPATAPWLCRPRSLLARLRSPRCCVRREERERRERKNRKRMRPLGFWETGRPQAGLLFSLARATVRSAPTAPDARAGDAAQAGARGRPALPAQA